MLGKALSLAAAGNAAEEVDENFNQTVLLLHGDGTNGAQNNTFLDSSTNNFTITRNGNTTQGTFSPFSAPDGYWSNYFDGSSDYLNAGASADFDITSGNFTLELFLYRTASGAEQYLFSQRSGASAGWEWRINATNFLSFFFTGGSVVTGSTAVPSNSWVHLAVTRSSNTVRLFINGVQDTSATVSNGTSASTTNLLLGAGTTGGGVTVGYWSNARLVKGTALYTSAFTPPTAPLTAVAGTELLTCQSNRFVDNSSNAFTITKLNDVKVTPFSPFAPTAAYSASLNGGSGYFDGTGDYLLLPSNAAFAFGTGAYTIEAWVYLPAYAATQGSIFDSGNATGALDIGITSTGAVILSEYNVGNILTSTAGDVPLNAWTHVALVRESTASNDTFIYVNGVLVATGTNSKNWTVTTNPTVGGITIAGYLTIGYLSSVRVVKGTAVYTAAFTPPTAQLTAISGTSLLCNFTNAGIFDNTGKNNLETVGNAQIDTTTKKYGTGSIEFDGVGTEYLAVAGTTSDYKWLHDKTTDYTIEFWLYPNSVTGRRAILETAAASAASGVLLETNGTRLQYTIYRGVSGSFTNADAGASAVAIGQWYFVSIVVTTTQVKIYIDGVLKNTTSWSLAGSTAAQQRTLIIGGDTLDGTVVDFSGFIDDMRITRGVARDGTVVPTKAFPDL